MITLIRWWLYKSKEIKYKLAFWQFIDKQAMELIKNPENLENKIISEIAKIIHENNTLSEAGKKVFDIVNQKINS